MNISVSDVHTPIILRHSTSKISTNYQHNFRRRRAGCTIMSSSAEADEVCASCGTTTIDNIKLKKCGCKLVKYCSVDCQKNHRPQHKKACKKRMTELREDELFAQPDESHLGECSICCLPLSIDENESALNSCCCKRICLGCNHANILREEEQAQYPKCAFCREPLPKTNEEAHKNMVKRVKANDPEAITYVAKKRNSEGNYEVAFQYYTKAAELGDMDAHFRLSRLYYHGQGVEKNEKKEIYHMEEAAIGGHPWARYNLGCYEGRNGRIDRMVKHYIIAAKLGHDGALEVVKKNFLSGFVSKEDYEAALRGHQAAVDATKSKQRDAADAYGESETNSF
jgi:tetratricopeptide (TPR) repeat protein